MQLRGGGSDDGDVFQKIKKIKKYFEQFLL